MTVPRVFISSTYYDLRHVRNAVKEFVESLGFESVLSEQFDVFYSHGKSAQKSCLDEIGKCDMYILIIGTRYGSIFPNDSVSITHREYREAVRAKLPIFAFVDKYVYDDYRFYCQNKENRNASEIQYLNVREKEVFGFISEVEHRATNNALICFDQVTDITECLRKQLAKMFKEKAFQPSVKKEEVAEPTIDEAEYQNFVKNLDIVGIPSVKISDIEKNESLLQLLKSKADSVDDLGTDYRISIGGSIVNIGKEIVSLLSEQYQQMRR